MNHDDLAEVVNKFYSDHELVKTKLQELSKKRQNYAKARELMNIRIEFKYIHMSGKETLDVMLKKAYLFNFKTVSKEQIYVNEINELNELINLLNTQIIKVTANREPQSVIDKKTTERNILQKQYDKLIELQPEEEDINFNGVAIKILKILEKGDDESRRLHNIIKYKVCGTTTQDDLNIRRENLKYLAGETRAEEEKKIDQIESNIKSREKGNRNSKDIRSYRVGMNKSSFGYVPPHLRQNEVSVEESVENDFNKSKSAINLSDYAGKCEELDQHFPTIRNVQSMPSLSGEKSNVTNKLGGWGNRSFADLLKSETKETVEECKNPECETISSTIEVINETKPTKNTKQLTKVVEIDDWGIEEN